MYLQIIDILPEKIWEYNNNFSESYLYSLQQKPFFNESLSARVLISEYIWNGYLPQEDENGIPHFQDNNYWSLSHKQWCVFVWVSKSEIGVDIEFLLEKSLELLDYFPLSFYGILGWKNWKNFYILWTSLEALQKMKRWENLEIQCLTLKDFQGIKASLFGISFQTRTLYVCKGKNYQVFTGFHENKVYSVCISQNIDYEIIS